MDFKVIQKGKKKKEDKNNFSFFFLFPSFFNHVG